MSTRKSNMKQFLMMSKEEIIKLANEISLQLLATKSHIDHPWLICKLEQIYNKKLAMKNKKEAPSYIELTLKRGIFIGVLIGVATGSIIGTVITYQLCK